MTSPVPCLWTGRGRVKQVCNLRYQNPLQCGFRLGSIVLRHGTWALASGLLLTAGMLGLAGLLVLLVPRRRR